MKLCKKVNGKKTRIHRKKVTRTILYIQTKEEGDIIKNEEIKGNSKRKIKK